MRDDDVEGRADDDHREEPRSHQSPDRDERAHAARFCTLRAIAKWA